MKLTPELARKLISQGRASAEQLDDCGADFVFTAKSEPATMQHRLVARDVLIRKDTDETRTISFIASDETTDRMGDIVSVKGWDLRNFRSNPIILLQHNPDNPIGTGKATKGQKPGGDPALLMDITFAPADASAFAEQTFQLVKAGVLRANSVGFMPIKTTRPETAEERETMGLGPYGVKFDKAELFEDSVVSVPANPAAVALAMEGMVQRSVLTQDQADLFMHDGLGAQPSDYFDATRRTVHMLGNIGQQLRNALADGDDELTDEERARDEDQGEDTDKPKKPKKPKGEHADDEDDEDEKPKSVTVDYLRSVATKGSVRDRLQEMARAGNPLAPFGMNEDGTLMDIQPAKYFCPDYGAAEDPCPGEKAYIREFHPDTGQDEHRLYCPDCGDDFGLEGLELEQTSPATIDGEPIKSNPFSFTRMREAFASGDWTGAEFERQVVDDLAGRSGSEALFSTGGIHTSGYVQTLGTTGGDAPWQITYPAPTIQLDQPLADAAIAATLKALADAQTEQITATRQLVDVLQDLARKVLDLNGKTVTTSVVPDPGGGTGDEEIDSDTLRTLGEALTRLAASASRKTA